MPTYLPIIFIIYHLLVQIIALAPDFTKLDKTSILSIPVIQMEIFQTA